MAQGTSPADQQTNEQVINGWDSSAMISAEEIGLRSLTPQLYVPLY